MQFAYAPTTMPSGLPPSPTLTNPDMILPYQPSPVSRWQTSSSSESSPENPRHHFENFSSTSVHESRPTRSDSLRTKKRLKPAGQSLSPFRNGVLSHPGGPTRARSVTEREKAADGRIRFENSRLSYRPITEQITVSPSTRTNHYSTNRVIIIEDDEQSEVPTERSRVPDNTYKTPSILDEDEDNPNSHMAMSRRAEEILAIAKKRLTNMEGNLTRARSTIGTRPSSSMSSFANGGNNEHASLYSPSNQSAKHRQTGSLDDSKANHSRGLSDSSNTEGSPKEDGLGITNLENTDSGKQRFWNGVTRSTSVAQRERYQALEPLNEDGPAPENFSRDNTPLPNIQYEDEAMAQGFEDLQQASSPFSDFDSANPPPNTTLTRARSTTQMRDIRGQMQDLKGKISTLKQRARQDSLYRRSLSNLRTPSPFTAAEQWYTGVPLHEERTASVSPQPHVLPRRKSSPRDSDPSAEDQPNGHVKNSPGTEDDNSGRQVQEEEVERPNTALDTTLPPAAVAPLEQDNNPIEFIDNVTPSRDSLPSLPPADEEEAASLLDVDDSINGDTDQYHDTSTLPLGERHEDRPDAFDYEHFFLHSGMGHHKTGASRSSSRSSYSSVETTKPEDHSPISPTTNGLPKTHHHLRKDSVDSTTSFTTARSSSPPRNIVIPPTRSDSLKYRSPTTIKGNHHVPQNPSRSRSSKSQNSRNKSTGIRPPSNSFSSSHPTSIAALQNQAVHDQPPPPPPKLSTSVSSSPLLGYLAASLSASGSPNLQRRGSKPATDDNGGGGFGINLSEKDALLADRLFRSLARCCADLDAVGEEDDGKRYEARMLRRRLDAARKVLEGEVSGEVF